MWLGWVASAIAQVVAGGASPDLNAQVFRPTLDGAGLLWADDAARRPRDGFAGRFLLQYVDDPLVYELADGERVGLLTSVVQADLLGGVQIGRLRAGVQVPVYLFATGEGAGDEGGLGDLGLDGKVTALEGPIDLAANLRITLPTHTVQGPLGSSTTGWELAAIVSREFGPVLLAANLGTRGGPPAVLENVTLNDGFVARGAVGYALSGDAGIAAEIAGTVPYASPLANVAGLPLEVLGSGYGYTGRDVVIRGGIGTGLTPGIGAPEYRLLLGVGYEPRASHDTDRDGLLDPVDACPREPEDEDRWEDEDGCPDPDNDQDRILDGDDRCQGPQEDHDGFEDADGCPDPTTPLRVVVRDAATAAEIGIGKVSVTCGERVDEGGAPLEITLPPGPCVVTATAATYEPAEVAVEVVDGPLIDVAVLLTPRPEATLTVTRERIALRESVRFEVAEAVILPASFPMLDETAKVLQDYPEIRKLRIEGHSDERGPDDYNLDLSRRRARAVLDYLVSKGIDAGRLSSEGFGESRPLDPGHTEAAWAKNRRTDFFVDVWEATPTTTR